MLFRRLIYTSEEHSVVIQEKKSLLKQNLCMAFKCHVLKENSLLQTDFLNVHQFELIDKDKTHDMYVETHPVIEFVANGQILQDTTWQN